MRALSFPTLVAFGPQTSYHIRRRTVWAEPTLLFRQQVSRLAVGAESRSDDLEKDLIRVCHEGNTAIVTALGPVLLFVQNLNHGISPSLRYAYFPLVPHPLDHPVKHPEHGRVVVYPEFEATAFAFAIGLAYSLCVCVCFPPIHSGHQVRWTYQPGSHRIYHPPSFCGACLNFSREKDSAVPFPRRP